MKFESKSYFSCGKIVTLTKGTHPSPIYATNYPKFHVNKLTKKLKNYMLKKLLDLKKTNHGLDVYLNFKKKDNIRMIIAERLDEYYSF